MNAKTHPKPRTLTELDEVDPLSDEEEAALQAAIASDPERAKRLEDIAGGAEAAAAARLEDESALSPAPAKNGRMRLKSGPAFRRLFHRYFPVAGSRAEPTVKIKADLMKRGRFRMFSSQRGGTS